MPKFSVLILERARSDINTILSWISERSHAGAFRWIYSLINAIVTLENSPEIFPLAQETTLLGREIRNLAFKTKNRKAYRLIYILEGGKEVNVLRIREPGQASLKMDEVE